MEICSRFTGMERKDGAFLLHTDNADIKVCFVTDEIVRVRANANLSGRAPPSCYARPFGRLKAPLGLSLFRFAPQTRICYSPMEVPLSSLRPQIATIPLFL